MIDNQELIVFSVPKAIIDVTDIWGLFHATMSVKDRGGGIELPDHDKLDYRVAVGSEVERIAPFLVEWMEDIAAQCGRRLNRGDPEFVALNVVPSGGEYKPHRDTTTSAVLIVFLTEIEGGELYLPQMGISVSPRPGTALYLRGRDNLHGIAKVKSGIRITAVANLSGDDDIAPPDGDYA